MVVAKFCATHGPTPKAPGLKALGQKELTAMNRDIGAQVGGYSKSQPACHATLQRLFPLIVQLWMTAVLLIFIAIRVLGSHTVSNVLSKWSSR
jgi:hypothetical protein